MAQEVLAAIKSSKTGSARGLMVSQLYFIVNFNIPWSFPWWSILMPLDSSYMAYILVVPKPNKDLGEVDNLLSYFAY